MSSRDALLKLLLLDLLFDDDDILIALTLSNMNSQFLLGMNNYLMDRDSESEESVESDSESEESEVEEDPHHPQDQDDVDDDLHNQPKKKPAQVDDEQTRSQNAGLCEGNAHANVMKSQSSYGVIKPHAIKSEPADDHDMTHSHMTEIKREPLDELMEMDCFNIEGVKVEVETDEDCDSIDLPSDTNVSGVAIADRVESPCPTSFDLSDATVKMQHKSDCKSKQAIPAVTSSVEIKTEAGGDITDLYHHDQPTPGSEIRVKTEPNTVDTESHSFESWLVYRETNNCQSGAASVLTTSTTASNGGNDTSSVSDQHPLLHRILRDNTC